MADRAEAPLAAWGAPVPLPVMPGWRPVGMPGQLRAPLGSIQLLVYFTPHMSALEAIYYVASTLPERERPAFTAETIAKFKAAGGVIADGETPHVAEPRPDAATVKAASRAMLAARKRGPRGPRVKPNPRLPETAPEIYRDRKPREELGGRKEKLVPFLHRVYGPLLKIMKHADLLRLDRSAAKAIYNCKDGKKLPPDLLPKESELNTKLLIESDITTKFLRGNDVTADAEELRLVRVLEQRLRRALAPT